MERIAAKTNNLIRDLWRVPAGLHGRKGLAVKRLVLG